MSAIPNTTRKPNVRFATDDGLVWYTPDFIELARDGKSWRVTLLTDGDLVTGFGLGPRPAYRAALRQARLLHRARHDVPRLHAALTRKQHQRTRLTRLLRDTGLKVRELRSALQLAAEEAETLRAALDQRDAEIARLLQQRDQMGPPTGAVAAPSRNRNLGFTDPDLKQRTSDAIRTVLARSDAPLTYTELEQGVRSLLGGNNTAFARALGHLITDNVVLGVKGGRYVLAEAAGAAANG